MTEQEKRLAKNRGRPATGRGQTIGVRMLPDQLEQLDAWIASQAGEMTRPEAIRRLVSLGLPRTTNVSVSDEQHSWGGDAVMTAPKPKHTK
jgi:hypothetical protein